MPSSKLELGHPHRNMVVLLLALWSLAWALQGCCKEDMAAMMTVPAPSQMASATQASRSGATSRRQLRLVSRPRSLLASTTTANTTIDPTLAAQFQLLLAFKANNEDCYASTDDWPTTVPNKPDGWPGVGVKNNRIVSIDFSRRNLCSNDVLSIWSKFPDLTKLDISLNNFESKTLPASWSVLTSLTHLDARASESYTLSPDIYDYDYGDYASYTSPMPSEWSRLTRLTGLALDGWIVEGKLPSSWSTLKSLKTLTLPAGGLNGPDLPASWGQLASLTQLILPGVIEWPGNSANVSGQTLLPAAWSGLKNLKAFDTPCRNLISKPGQNGIPIAPYLTSLVAHCTGTGGSGCAAAVEVTQLTMLAQMTNLVDLNIDVETVLDYAPQCLPPKGAFTFPTQWSSLKKLSRVAIKRYRTPGGHWQDAHLYDIQFDVMIPPQWSALTRLQSLDIDLSGWARGYASSPPPSFSSLTALTHLSMEGAYYNPYYMYNFDKGNNADALIKKRAGWKLPATWNTLTRLQTLKLNMYGMTNMQLPESYSTLTSLTELDLSGNCLQGSLPSSWGGMKKLSTITLPQNEDDLYKEGLCRRTALPTGPLPAGWGQLEKVTQLKLTGFQLTGTLPTSWSRLISLENLVLAGNFLKGPLPSSWSSLAKLNSLDLSKNKLNGPLPSSWSKLRSVQALDLTANRFSGQLPESWSSLTSLRSLVLANNSLSGTIPRVWLGVFQHPARQNPDDFNEFTLDVSHNFLTGPIPAWLGDVKNTWPQVQFILSYNKLSGTIPATPWKVGKLDVSHNYISGTLPASWSGIFSINRVYLDLSYNRISGALPAAWATAAPVTQASLYLSQNKLTGSIPKAYENFPVLYLNDNQLKGAVVVPKWEKPTPDSEFDYSWAVREWDLSGNRLSGPLPTTFKLSQWCTLSLARNNLSGTLPAGWFPAASTKSSWFRVNLDISYNTFTGVVPATWAAATFLNATHNRLSGLSPKEWGTIWTQTGWVWFTEFDEGLDLEPRVVPALDLSHNSLNGSLPKAMYGVKHLDLHKNKLSGSVPPAGSNWIKSGFWAALRYVDLSDNAFTGKAPAKPNSTAYFNVKGNKFSG